MMKYKNSPISSDIEQAYVNSAFSRYKTVIQEQYALAKNNIDFFYTDSVSYKERQFLLEVLQEFLDSTKD